MTQTTTNRFLFRTAPGHIYSPAQERETESMCSPYIMQQLTATLAGPDPFAVEEVLTLTWPMPDGSTGQMQVTIPAATTLAAATDLIANAWSGGAGANLYTATSNGVSVITFVARSPNVSIPAANFTATFAPNNHTLTFAQTVAAAAPSLRMGVFYVYTTVAQPLAISGTPRGARPAALPTSTTTIDQLRGVVGRVVNQTTLSPTFNSLADFDAYSPPQIWPGLLRGEVAVVVDPASPAITDSLTQQIHVVINAGAYSVIGSVAGAADGANTIRIDAAPAGNILGRVVAREENLAPFSQSSGRYVQLRVNRTN